MTSDCAPACVGECRECSPPLPETCEACLGEIEDDLRIVAGVRVHERCGLFWMGLDLLGEFMVPARLEVC